MSRVACVVIASENRKGLVHSRVLPSVLRQSFDEVVLAHDWPHATALGEDVRFVRVGPVQRNTLDALLKRDAGALATTADVIVYLSDDHALGPDFLTDLRAVLDEPWDVLVPNRFTYREGETVPLNNGEGERYCGGHCGVFRRDLVVSLPWVRFQRLPHPLLWDREGSYEQRRYGARFVWHPRAGIAVEDLEPENFPWR